MASASSVEASIGVMCTRQPRSPSTTKRLPARRFRSCTDPWTPDEVDLWRQDPLAVLEHYMPQARKLVSRYDLQLPDQIHVPDISATQSALGYQPEHNFVSFLRELAEREQAGDAATWLAQPG